MEHFYKRVTSDDFDQQKFAEASVNVTLKVDGTPMQIFFEGSEFKFCKRPKDEKSQGEQITRMEAFTNPAFYPIMKSLTPFLKDNIDRFNGVKIINTEILVDNTHHFVQYKTKPKGNLCVLNGFTTNDKAINTKMLKAYADILNVEAVPVIFSGVLGEKMNKLVEYVKKYCDPHNPSSSGNSLKDDIFQILGASSDSPLFDTQDGNVEGFVFDFNFGEEHKLYKVDDPTFVQHGIDGRAEGMSDEDRNKMNAAIRNIYKRMRNGQIHFNKTASDDFEGILRNFAQMCSDDTGIVSYIYDQGQSCILSDMLYSKDASMLPKNFRKFQNDTKTLYALRIFVWIFSKVDKTNNPNIKEFSKIMS